MLRVKYLFTLFMLCYLLPALASNSVVYVYTMEDITSNQFDGGKYIIKKTINLGGSSVMMPRYSKIVFRGGCFTNGTLVGNNTFIKLTKKNVFTDCTIEGTWEADCAYSSMFNEDIESLLLLKNLSYLSPNIKLYANRDYCIDAMGELITAESISAASREKPIIRFHTTDPDLQGIRIMGEMISLNDLIIIDDYDVNNDILYGNNNPLIGNTISIESKTNQVESLLIENCEFRGGTSSSFVASSQTNNCLVRNCTFTGYMADHGVYCSMKVENFIVEDCKIEDVPHVVGIFKARSSEKLKKFSISKVAVHNYNGYFAMVSLLETPEAELVFDNIKVTKDIDNYSVFYGLGIDRENNEQEDYNAKEITITNCSFDYGYNGNSLVYSSAGRGAYIRNGFFSNVYSKESNFGGFKSETLVVKNCVFENFLGDKGLPLTTSHLLIDKTKLLCGTIKSNCLFLINYFDIETKDVKFKKSLIDIQAPYLLSIASGSEINVDFYKCNISHFSQSLFFAPHGFNISYRNKESTISMGEHNSYTVTF